ncbi:pyrimidine dimer DNA glycosylase/endonuclease V [Corynebacterium sp. TAE3-ERU12]|uniref:pyrimidine dimer DNA glycosylase/endonuclease V n=1 Tax=Corynebacterium sp. TAE3-ERU12 TaxID=2849491 RepID=UPI001C44F094|nr:pyrimidine dimer DNA glycosylase/endonuclease V [Corynebacterium sp. TAE3-ERU12]MBV7295011.1 pyrimidine dimer DNA glycosylase/endonuclease V [Corynebacterium sp. TAE3-ERU12]
MRIWSMHPEYLDRVGLVACWRETLLAQKVLDGGTKGYRNHPQLVRFREHRQPLAAVGAYLAGIQDEAVVRGYKFDRSKILVPPQPGVELDRIDLTEGQLAYEFTHLRAKLDARAPDVLANELWAAGTDRPHPLFRLIPGEVQDWERV